MHKNLIFAVLLAVTAGCGSSHQAFEPLSNNDSNNSVGANPTPRPGTTSPTPAPTPTAGLGICGPLDFSGITWSSSLTAKGRKALALGLEVTGSYEGRQSWSTIANNADGQGMSLGLLQQNFGQGTLQPLLVSMFASNRSTLEQIFTPADLSSMKTMLNSWDSTLHIQNESNELFPEQIMNPLEEGGDEFAHIMAVENQSSVSWAKSNVYSNGGTTFVARWKTGFQNLAASQPYKSLQASSALTMFEQAAAYFKVFGFKEMRSLLLMMDFVVQNGGFNATHKANYAAYVAANPGASETAKALKLLEIRLVSVRAAYVSDVSARKKTIINGTGTVHGTSRNLPKEYCYNSSETVSL